LFLISGQNVIIAAGILKKERNRRMKKRALLFAVSLCIIMLAGGCNTKKDLFTDSNSNTSQNNENKGTDNTGNATVTPTATPAPAKPDYVVDDYIKLGQYKGVEVDKVEVASVTDSDITNKINSDLASKNTTEEVTDRTDVRKGDIVNIDYEGLKDGVAFDNGTATGADLTIGSGQFIPGFEDQLVGAKVGDKLDVNVTFPADYPNAPDLAGQPVVFKVTINSIKKSVTPELNDEF
jgi:trigger factor